MINLQQKYITFTLIKNNNNFHSISRKILNIFKNANKKLILIKSGDHSLSKKNNLKKLISEIEIIYNRLTYKL